MAYAVLHLANASRTIVRPNPAWGYIVAYYCQYVLGVFHGYIFSIQLRAYFGSRSSGARLASSALIRNDRQGLEAQNLPNGLYSSTSAVVELRSISHTQYAYCTSKTFKLLIWAFHFPESKNCSSENNWSTKKHLFRWFLHELSILSFACTIGLVEFSFPSINLIFFCCIPSRVDVTAVRLDWKWRGFSIERCLLDSTFTGFSLSHYDLNNPNPSKYGVYTQLKEYSKICQQAVQVSRGFKTH
jgi:hypothetical protein